MKGKMAKRIWNPSDLRSHAYGSAITPSSMANRYCSQGHSGIRRASLYSCSECQRQKLQKACGSPNQTNCPTRWHHQRLIGLSSFTNLLNKFGGGCTKGPILMMLVPPIGHFNLSHLYTLYCQKYRFYYQMINTLKLSNLLFTKILIGEQNVKILWFNNILLPFKFNEQCMGHSKITCILLYKSLK